MKWNDVQNLSSSRFKRLVGVKPRTFRAMVKEVKRDGRKKKRSRKNNMRKSGRPFKLSIEDQLLMTLMYWREYRTLFHTGLDFGVSESIACRTIKRIEDKLSRSDKFKLPAKKRPKETQWKYEVVLVDATEVPIERPKKNSIGTTRGKRKSTR